jgi:iron complex outermembrane receptor protein
VTRGGAVHSLSLRAENLGDAVHREATSRVKDFAPGPGRNLSLVYRVFF